MNIDDTSLGNHILDILEENIEGISEYDLINELKQIPALSDETENVFDNNLNLFQFHFILFHSLYNLRDRLLKDCKYFIDISSIKITLLPYSDDVSTCLAVPDPLYEYYMDLENLQDKTENDVNELITGFWEIFIRNDKRKDALLEMGLTDDADDTTIKIQYRRLVMEHHPDRGGDKQRLQIINSAMEVLQIKNSNQTQ